MGLRRLRGALRQRGLRRRLAPRSRGADHIRRGGPGRLSAEAARGQARRAREVGRLVAHLRRRKRVAALDGRRVHDQGGAIAPPRYVHARGARRRAVPRLGARGRISAKLHGVRRRRLGHAPGRRRRRRLCAAGVVAARFARPGGPDGRRGRRRGNIGRDATPPAQKLRLGRLRLRENARRPRDAPNFSAPRSGADGGLRGFKAPDHGRRHCLAWPRRRRHRRQAPKAFERRKRAVGGPRFAHAETRGGATAVVRDGGVADGQRRGYLPRKRLRRRHVQRPAALRRHRGPKRRLRLRFPAARRRGDVCARRPRVRAGGARQSLAPPGRHRRCGRLGDRRVFDGAEEQRTHHIDRRAPHRRHFARRPGAPPPRRFRRRNR
mmetsp:Transcript_12177/g.42119  ORF Transcript_12177/g.42119 Transcript_12177/m.42119 type:complete len:379 (+) Transcript_12177:511-1647(+)